ncbi:hypothetical protein, partial [Magnetospirillum sp. SS-4]|uniref:hypothetical protein n=1 Tax=Magnetospirillum sp. SS-4 TaxID=2681465 RepID=UPI001C2DCB94
VLDPQTLDIGPFLWFGGAGGCSLPPINHLPITKHSKANAAGEKLERERHRKVDRKLFTEVPDIEGLVDLLFSENGDLLHPASINHGLWRELTQRGHPFVEISWNSPKGCFSAFCTPGVMSAEINGQRTNYIDLIIDIAHQVGSKINHMSAPVGVPLAFDIMPITDPVKALEFISLCQINGIIVLPITTQVATDCP